jgi:hypothetical protein
VVIHIVFSFLHCKNHLNRKFWCNYSKVVSPQNDKVGEIYIENHLALIYHLSVNGFWKNVCHYSCNLNTFFTRLWKLFKGGHYSLRLVDRKFLNFWLKILIIDHCVIHCAHNCNQPYDEMHQGHWLKFKFGFP